MAGGCLSRPRVYLETSFISYLATALQQRHSSDVNTAHRQIVSALWWTRHRQEFDRFISETVVRECSGGHAEAVSHRLPILAEAELLGNTREIMELTARLVEPVGPLPRKAEADATHIAFASVYGCDYLLTWNFKHIANAFLQPTLHRMVESYGYTPAFICTPEQLLAGDRNL
jgi:hypothetical protein